MSRTFKDRPYWVKKFDPDYGAHIDHDHRKGECVVEDLAAARRETTQRHNRYRHYRYCNKIEIIVTHCTREHPQQPAHPWMPECWTASGYGFVNGRFHWVINGCRGHETIINYPENDCSCDRWPDYPNTTCYMEMGGSRRYYSMFADGPPSEFVREDYHAPERRRARDELRNIAKEYNATGDLDEITDDYYSRPARNSAKWNWY